jgi:hypothetical protein
MDSIQTNMTVLNVGDLVALVGERLVFGVVVRIDNGEVYFQGEFENRLTLFLPIYPHERFYSIGAEEIRVYMAQLLARTISGADYLGEGAIDWMRLHLSSPLPMRPETCHPACQEHALQLSVDTWPESNDVRRGLMYWALFGYGQVPTRRVDL